MSTPQQPPTEDAQLLRADDPPPQWSGEQLPAGGVVLALQGGGKRAPTIAAGFLRGLKAIGVLDRASVVAGCSGAQLAVAGLGYSTHPLDQLLWMSRVPADLGVPKYASIATDGDLPLDVAEPQSMGYPFTTAAAPGFCGNVCLVLRHLCELPSLLFGGVSFAWRYYLQVGFLKPMGVDASKITARDAASVDRAVKKGFRRDDFIIANQGVPEPVFTFRMASPSADNDEFLWRVLKANWNVILAANKTNKTNKKGEPEPQDAIGSIQVAVDACNEVGGVTSLLYDARPDHVGCFYDRTIPAFTPAQKGCCKPNGWPELPFKPTRTAVTEFTGRGNFRLIDSISAGLAIEPANVDRGLWNKSGGPGGKLGPGAFGPDSLNPGFSQPTDEWFKDWAAANRSDRQTFKVRPGGNPSEKPLDLLFDDSGFVDTTAILPLLARGAKKIIAMTNVAPGPVYQKLEPLPDGSPNVSKDFASVVFGWLSLFGIPQWERTFITSQQMVFGGGRDKVLELRRQLDKCLDNGEPLIAVMKGLDVLDNPFFGIKGGYKVDVLLYIRDNAVPRKWSDAVPEDKWPQGFPSLESFSSGYPLPLSNMVQDMSCWAVTSSKEKFEALLAD